MITRLPRVKPDAYAVCPPRFVPSPGFVFHTRDGSTLRAFEVDPTGIVLAELGNGLPDFDVFDSRQNCLPRSAGYHRAARLFHSGPEIRLYDWAAGQILTYRAPEPWTAGPPQWVGNEFRWIEWLPVDTAAFEPTPARLMSAGRDFAEPTESARLDVAIEIDGVWSGDFHGPDFSATATALYLQHLSEQERWVRVRFTGATGEQGEAVNFELTTRRAGWPVDGGSLRLGLSEGAAAVQFWDGGLTSGYEPWIPDTWPPTGEGYLDLLVDGGRVYLYSLPVLSSVIPAQPEPDTELPFFVEPQGQLTFGFCTL